MKTEALILLHVYISSVRSACQVSVGESICNKVGSSPTELHCTALLLVVVVHAINVGSPEIVFFHLHLLVCLCCVILERSMGWWGMNDDLWVYLELGKKTLSESAINKQSSRIIIFSLIHFLFSYD